VQKVIVFFFILVISSQSLVSQNDFFLERYFDLQPDINVFANRNCNNDSARTLLFFEPLSRNGPVLVSDMLTNRLHPLFYEHIGIERGRMTGTYFWDPHTRNNYIYVQPIFHFWGDMDYGWSLLDFSNRHLSFHFQSLIYASRQYWANNSPPLVQLNETTLFTANYEVQWDSRINPTGPLTPFINSFRIINTTLNEVIWTFDLTTERFYNVYWITEYWCFILNGGAVALNNSGRKDTILNYKTSETISFFPEIIIGYGDGVILTTTETEDGFIGITVWTPDREILFRDSNFSISGIIDREHGRITWGRPSISIGYFDFPYIYISLSRGRGNHPPYATLIMNLITRKTYFTPIGYHLFAIF